MLLLLACCFASDLLCVFADRERETAWLHWCWAFSDVCQEVIKMHWSGHWGAHLSSEGERLPRSCPWKHGVYFLYQGVYLYEFLSNWHCSLLFQAFSKCTGNLHQKSVWSSHDWSLGRTIHHAELSYTMEVIFLSHYALLVFRQHLL